MRQSLPSRQIGAKMVQKPAQRVGIPPLCTRLSSLWRQMRLL